jgi:hypothetical protein
MGKTAHLADLINLALAWQKRLFEDELAKDAANRPHIDSRRVFCRAEEQLGGSEAGEKRELSRRTPLRADEEDSPIPQCHYELSHIAQRITVRPRQPKISDLDLPSIVHEQVAGL